MRFQRATQAVTLAGFVALMAWAGYPYHEGLAVDFFLRLDPLIGVGTIVGSRSFPLALLPGLILLLAALVLGRVFCGHICPMGTTIDVLRYAVGPRRDPPAKSASYEATNRFRSWKYLILAAILAAGVAGVSLVHLGSPLSLVTRLYALCLHPLALMAGDWGLSWGAPLFGAVGLDELAYIQVSKRLFATNLFVAALFCGIGLLAYWQPRFWCRNLCPAGALLALFSPRALFRRVISDECTGCNRCVRECPTGAIRDDPSLTVHSECIMCLHCRELCPEAAVSFGPHWSKGESSLAGPDPTRRGILMAVAGGVITAGLLRSGLSQPRLSDKEGGLVDPELIRPPGALPEAQFRTVCVRCGECMRACPTNTLQPIWLLAGLEGIFSPVMTPRQGACATNCNVCGKVCPTGAIRDLPLIEKQHAKVGTAWINRRNCLVWEQDKKCLVCDECCPYKAISLRPVAGLSHLAPFVLANQCSGCGYCENKCPVEGQSAIRVNIIGEIRLASGSYQEKAKEYGLLFRKRDGFADGLSPGALDPPDTAYPVESQGMEPGNLQRGFTDE